MNRRSDLMCDFIDLVYYLGMVLSVVVSYEKYHSVGWSALYGAISWVYIVYHLVTGG